MEHKPDIFYVTKTISKSQYKKLLKEAHDFCYNWWVDDKPTWSRRKIDMSLEEVLEIFDKTPRKDLHMTFIHRLSCCKAEKEHLEIGFCTLIRKDEQGNIHPNGDIFLWIEVDMQHKDYLTKKYKLEKRL